MRGTTKTLPALVLAAAWLGAPAVRAEPSLCTQDEVTVWSCSAKEHVHSLCASRDLGPTAGYLQYRAGTQSGVEFRFPEALRHPAGLIELRLAPRGATLAFRNGKREYSIHEPLTGPTTVFVLEDAGSISMTTCDWSTDTLTLTGTQDRFGRIGIFQ